MADHQSQILRALLASDNRYISGNELAKRFNISRPAVYNNILKLEQSGHIIETRKGIGYAYLKSNCFNAQVIEHYRVTSYPVRVHVFDQLTSTNDYAKQYATERTVFKPQIFITDTQTKGRGRLGRRFYSPSGTGIYMSLLIPMQTRQAIHSGLITTGMAVCVVRSLKPFFPQVDFRVKWVNDILAHDKKCGGILTETTSSLEDGSHENVIIGIGLNIDSEGFPDPIKHKAGAIVAHSQADRNQIVARVIDNFFYMFQTYQTGNFLAEYAELSDILGRKIRVEMGTRVYTGIADHFDNEGALVMTTTSGQLTISSGEVTKVYLPESGYQG